MLLAMAWRSAQAGRRPERADDAGGLAGLGLFVITLLSGELAGVWRARNWRRAAAWNWRASRRS
jgi:hypothetical protein